MAIGTQIFGESEEDGVIAKVYGAPKLATIMAASLEMLEALKMAVEKTDWIAASDGHWIANCRAAIAKAEGKEK